MSPLLLDSRPFAVIFDVHPVGRLNGYKSDASGYLRPSIALIPSVEATYNTSSEYAPGTVNNPYQVVVPQS